MTSGLFGDQQQPDFVAKLQLAGFDFTRPYFLDQELTEESFYLVEALYRGKWYRGNI